jgi:transcriptional regulator
MADSPQAFIDELLASIVALDVTVTRLVGKSKLSQNREARDVLGAAHALKAQGDDVMADAMLARLSERRDDETETS